MGLRLVRVDYWLRRLLQVVQAEMCKDCFRFLFFELEEKKPALLLHLLKVFAETTVFGSVPSLQAG
jgi:hypothetical protein